MHAGGWGKPPVDEQGKPLYGDVFGIQQQEAPVMEEDEQIESQPWGELESESEEESESEVHHFLVFKNNSLDRKKSSNAAEKRGEPASWKKSVLQNGRYHFRTEKEGLVSGAALVKE